MTIQYHQCCTEVNERANPVMLGLQNVNFGLTMSFNVESREFIQILHDSSSIVLHDFKT